MVIPNLIAAVVKGNRIDESGTVVAVKEKYLVDAVTPTEAEARLASEIAPDIIEFTVHSTAIEKVDEFFIQDANGEFFKVVFSIITIDEKSGKEKRSRHVSYTRSSSFESALPDFLAGMKGTMIDYEIESITRAHIVDLITNVSESN